LPSAPTTARSNLCSPLLPLAADGQSVLLRRRWVLRNAVGSTRSFWRHGGDRLAEKSNSPEVRHTVSRSAGWVRTRRR
jgi:hypothetical protein